ncbi:MAG: response regulator, partial [Bacteroidetes bacterium]|nr:response regulator [Bacteroidota bacterium]
MKLLIVEDQLELADNIKAYLSRGDVVCEVARSFAEAQDRLISFAYDIVLLDLMLPDGNGLNILRLLKRLSPET